jgi:hypothetical protein
MEMLLLRFHFKKGQRVALAGPYYQKSVKLVCAKFRSSCVSKIAVVNSQSESRNLIWSEPPSSFPTMRYGINSIHDGDVNRSSLTFSTWYGFC